MADEQKNIVQNKAEEVVKKKKKKIIRMIALKVIPPILIPIIIASAVFVLITGVINLLSNLGETILSLITVDENGIKITDEQIDQIIATIEASGTDLEDLELLRRH